MLMTKFNGKDTHIHKIDKLNDTTGALNPLNSSLNNKKIILNGNYTKFSGITDITANGDVKWKDVPVSASLRNGNTIRLDTDPLKTNYHFKDLPVFGIVNPLAGPNGKELITISDQYLFHF